ncbi:EC1118_1H21_0518p [Saccharomyces cerevisiae EC1118]|uniref:EC1118_1H21_0518p n=1 Tax=Saccharomyces cerevisiae (strain Lalvin EC1118 / Prise de mousse) TaxID=643680 RepID=C8ZA58_YEAS8|nr:EC1118_1H21_0518p [Saccharomyces cerevisiae EC1118]
MDLYPPASWAALVPFCKALTFKVPVVLGNRNPSPPLPLPPMVLSLSLLIPLSRLSLSGSSDTADGSLLISCISRGSCGIFRMGCEAVKGRSLGCLLPRSNCTYGCMSLRKYVSVCSM